MSHDDPRHGTNAGYIQGCRNQCCKNAHAKYKRDRRARVYLAGGPLGVPAQGAIRRIQALIWLGWTMEEISIEAGHQHSWAHLLMKREHIYRSSHDAIVAVYDRWSMTFPPPGRFRSRTRAFARNRGYAPPLAWDDIDTDTCPRTGRPSSKDGLDEAVILRVLGGETVDTTRAEKDEVMRRWLAQGHSARSLEVRMGWKSGRYGRDVSQRETA